MTEQRFTDEDLKRLTMQIEYAIEKHIVQLNSPEIMKALLVRLEAVVLAAEEYYTFPSSHNRMNLKAVLAALRESEKTK